MPDVLGAKYGAFETNMAHCGGWIGLRSGAEECSGPIRYGNVISERAWWARLMLHQRRPPGDSLSRSGRCLEMEGDTGYRDSIVWLGTGCLAEMHVCESTLLRSVFLRLSCIGICCHIWNMGDIVISWKGDCNFLGRRYITFSQKDHSTISVRLAYFPKVSRWDLLGKS